MRAVPPRGDGSPHPSRIRPRWMARAAAEPEASGSRPGRGRGCRRFRRPDLHRGRHRWPIRPPRCGCRQRSWQPPGQRQTPHPAQTLARDRVASTIPDASRTFAGSPEGRARGVKRCARGRRTPAKLSGMRLRRGVPGRGPRAKRPPTMNWHSPGALPRNGTSSRRPVPAGRATARAIRRPRAERRRESPRRPRWKGTRQVRRSPRASTSGRAARGREAPPRGRDRPEGPQYCL